ncbi:MAG: homocysteine S-methyltransferase family protein [Oscillospiraceae bacterium]
MDNDNPRSMLLDGATGTNLYLRGMPQGVCIEEWILDHPEVIQEIQSRFIEAGSDIIYAPTFSANREKLGFYGHADKVLELNHRLVALSKEVAGDKLVAGGMSPTGLFVEPFGETSFDELVSIYSQQAEALNTAGVDLFVIETMLSLTETRAAVLACRGYHKPIYVTITVNERGKTLSGASAFTCLVVLQELGISGFGLNCSFGPELIGEQLKEIAPFAKIPLIAKPNAGQPNPLLENTYELSPTIMSQMMKEVLDAGATIIGGCCGTTPDHIREMRKLLNSYHHDEENKPYREQANDMLLANETEIFALDNDRIEFSEPIYCEFDMADTLLSCEEESFDVIQIYLETIDEALQFSLNSHFAKLPICFHSSSIAALERALYLYSGRAMIDCQCPIERDELNQLAKKYGAIVY